MEATGRLHHILCYHCCQFHNGGKKQRKEISIKLPKYSYSRSLLCEGYLEIILLAIDLQSDSDCDEERDTQEGVLMVVIYYRNTQE